MQDSQEILNYIMQSYLSYHTCFICPWFPIVEGYFQQCTSVAISTLLYVSGTSQNEPAFKLCGFTNLRLVQIKSNSVTKDIQEYKLKVNLYLFKKLISAQETSSLCRLRL